MTCYQLAKKLTMSKDGDVGNAEQQSMLEVSNERFVMSTTTGQREEIVDICAELIQNIAIMIVIEKEANSPMTRVSYA